MSTNGLRPGVYSTYDISGRAYDTRSLQGAAVVARANGGSEGTVYHFSAYREAAAVFGDDGEGQTMLACIRMLFDAGVSTVVASPLEDDVEAALAGIEETDDIGAVILDSGDPDDLKQLRESVKRSSQAQRERIGFCALDDAQDAIAAAQALGHERVVLCCPGVFRAGTTRAAPVFGAVALAGAMLAERDPIHNFNGRRMNLIESPDRLEESVIGRLLEAGVTVFEQVGSWTECIRALTTAPVDGADRGLRSLNTVLIIDDVMQSVRAMLRTRLRGTRLTTTSLESIASQVTVELAEKRADGVLDSFDAPRVYSDPTDPAVCVVELGFRTAYLLSRIHIVAHITV